MAGLDRPTSGRLLDGDRDLTGVPVRQRNVAMVYQQFINYPSLTRLRKHRLAAARRAQERSGDRDARDAAGRDAAARRRSCRAIRPSCPAASSNARRWLARSRRTPSCCCSTSRSSISTTSCAKSCATELTQLFAERTNDRRVRDDRAAGSAAARRPYDACSPKDACCSPDRRWRCFGDPATLAAARAFSDPPLNVIPATRRLRSQRSASPTDGTAAAADRCARRGNATSCSAFARTSFRSPARPGRSRCAAASSSRRSAAPKRSSTSRATTCAWSRRSPASTTSRSTSPARCMFEPASLYGFDAQRRTAVRAGELSMARIDLDGRRSSRTRGAGATRGRCDR